MILVEVKLHTVRVKMKKVMFLDVKIMALIMTASKTTTSTWKPGEGRYVVDLVVVF
jgi:hypothetical protein